MIEANINSTDSYLDRDYSIQYPVKCDISCYVNSTVIVTVLILLVLTITNVVCLCKSRKKHNFAARRSSLAASPSQYTDNEL